ncbi:MAG: PAS domain-containing protein [Firmicutes bacterium]|jgi:predicted transcriptional regulator YheO|nr:PAS domain-containing protein [Bacillota bacterium]
MESETRNPVLEALITVARGVAQTFGPSCEVVVHDLSRPKTSVIAVFNDTVTGRKVGEGIRDLVWKVLRSPDFNEDMLVNYRTITPEGKVVKSTTIVIRDSERDVVGAVCINFDLSTFVTAKRFFEDFTRLNDLAPPSDKVVEVANADVLDILGHLISKTIEESAKSVEQMTKEDKMQVVGYLDEKGVFLIRGAVDWVASRLGVSRYTVYSYLEMARAARGMKRGGDREAAEPYEV